MKRILFFVLFFVIIFCLYPQNESLFIKYQWGSTMDSIIMNEGIPNDKYEDEIFFQNLHNIIYTNKMVTEYPTNVSYCFFDNKLHMIKYNVFGTYTIKKWVEIYFYLRDELKNIYDDYCLSYGEHDETDAQMIERFIQIFSVPIENNNFFVNIITFHRIVWPYLDTSIKMEFLYDYDINNFLIEIRFISPEYYKNTNELWFRRYH